MASNALIGDTGFVGGTLLQQRDFGSTYNSRNIETIRGRKFDYLVCAGVSAAKWIANRNPEQDWRNIGRLLDSLKAATVRHFILISTIDVYREPNGLTENDAPAVERLQPYGLHRLKIEQFVRENFVSHTIIRLPALFGAGLRKNALYDLINLNQVEKIVPNAEFQWYPVRRLADDIDRIRAAEIDLINITAEPIAMEDIRARFFPAVQIGPPASSPPRYDLRSIHDSLLGGHGGYHFSRRQIFDEMAAFIAQAKAPSQCGLQSPI
jgi:nucleoside-diphosphate-sugar epimerase